MTDAELLDQHHAGSPAAFATLVRRHADWVSGVARRRLGGDVHAADDVVQATFLVLATRSRTLGPTTVLPAWLFRVACNVAARAARDRARHARRERDAGALRALQQADAERSTTGEWAALAPILDELVEQLRQADRVAILLRFYRKGTHAEVGAALGVSEDAARKRVDRALERLRDLARRRGIAVPAVTATVIATCLAATSHATAGSVAIAATAAAASNGSPVFALGGHVIALTKGAAMAVPTAKLITLGALAACLVAGVSGYRIWRSTHSTTLPAAPSATTAGGGGAVPNSVDADAAEQQMVVSQSNLRQVAMAVLLFASGHGDRFPPTLGAMLPELWGTDPASQRSAARLFLAPNELAEGTIPPTLLPAWIDQHTSIAFLAHDCDAGYLERQPLRGQTVILHTSLAMPITVRGEPMINVAYADGRVEVRGVDAARQIIEQSKPVLEAARRSATLSPDERAVQTTQSNQLRIYRAMVARAAREDDPRYPETLGRTLEWLDGRAGIGPTESADVFLTPAAVDRAQDAMQNTPAWIDANASFVYLAAGVRMKAVPDEEQGRTVLLHTPLDRPMRNGAGLDLILMLFADGHSEAETVNRARAIIDRSKRTLEAARASASSTGLEPIIGHDRHGTWLAVDAAGRATAS